MLKVLILSLLLIPGPLNETFLGLECLPEKGIIKGFVKLGYNDFVFDYRYTIDDDQPFDASGKIDTSKIFVSKYLNRRIQISANEKKLNVKLLKVETLDQEVIIEFFYYFDQKAKLFKVKNLMLTEYEEDQSNHLIFKYNDFEEGITLTSENPEKTFKLK
jgi:hypothetical protein